MTTLTRKITLRSRDIEVRYAFPLTLADAAKRVNPNAQSGTSTWQYNGVLLKDIPV